MRLCSINSEARLAQARKYWQHIPITARVEGRPGPGVGERIGFTSEATIKADEVPSRLGISTQSGGRPITWSRRPCCASTTGPSRPHSGTTRRFRLCPWEKSWSSPASAWRLSRPTRTAAGTIRRWRRSSSPTRPRRYTCKPPLECGEIGSAPNPRSPQLDPPAALAVSLWHDQQSSQRHIRVQAREGP